MRLRANRFAAVAIVVLLIGGVIAAAYYYQARLARLAAFTERARTMETDIVTLKRGAAEDASAIAKAFDDREVKALLRDQSATWAKRVDQCKELDAQLDELVPQNDDQTAQELALQRDVARIQATAQALADAAKSGDVFATRVAAANLADAGTTSK